MLVTIPMTTSFLIDAVPATVIEKKEKPIDTPDCCTLFQDMTLVTSAKLFSNLLSDFDERVGVVTKNMEAKYRGGTSLVHASPCPSFQCFVFLIPRSVKL